MTEQVPNIHDAAARAEAINWLRGQLDWERLLAELQSFTEAEEVRRSDAA
jgi:hypothetical protein